MALDMAKYRRIFLEEATDHLAEISRALLDLEKDTSIVEAIDTIFRMAHSIKSMAASLGYDPVAELSHRMEDLMAPFARSTPFSQWAEDAGVADESVPPGEGPAGDPEEGEGDPGADLAALRAKLDALEARLKRR